MVPTCHQHILNRDKIRETIRLSESFYGHPSVGCLLYMSIRNQHNIFKISTHLNDMGIKLILYISFSVIRMLLRIQINQYLYEDFLKCSPCILYTFPNFDLIVGYHPNPLISLQNINTG